MVKKKLIYEEVDSKDNNLLKKSYITSYLKTNYIKCEGCYMPEIFKSYGDEIQQMDVRDDDIWLCGFPKSGTTWVREMLWCIANDLDFEAAKKDLALRFPFLELSAIFDMKMMLDECPETNFRDYNSDSFEYANKLPSPRFVKSHLPLPLLPEKLRNNSTSAKMVFTCRNPRDTCISLYHYLKSMHGYAGSFEQLTELFLQGKGGFYGSFFDHFEGFWPLRNNKNFLFLQYEEMKRDLRSVIHKTANFIGKSLTEDQVQKLLHHLSFSSMKQNNAVNLESHKQLVKKYVNDDTCFIRCGQVGQWEQIMDVQLRKKFEKWEDENLNEFNFTFSL